MTTEQMIAELRKLYGSEVAGADIRAFCIQKGIAYPTATRRLEDYKVGRGKWNLELTEAKEQLERAVGAPPAGRRRDPGVRSDQCPDCPVDISERT